MKNTKEKILDTALELFNGLGLSQVTLRTISKKIGMSQGNLNYHFKKRDDIIEALYFQLVKNIDETMSGSEMPSDILALLFDISKVMMTNFYDYRFFFLDFVQIVRENEKIKNHYAELSQQREAQFAMFFKHLIRDGIMRNEILPNEYSYLYKRFQILSEFWISDAENSSKKISPKEIEVYHDIFIQAIFPYLTKKGQEKYFEMLE